MSDSIKPLYIRVSQAQEVFAIHPSTIYRKADRGEITIHRRGSASWLKVSEMEAYIEGTAISA